MHKKINDTFWGRLALTTLLDEGHIFYVAWYIYSPIHFRPDSIGTLVAATRRDWHQAKNPKVASKSRDK